MKQHSHVSWGLFMVQTLCKELNEHLQKLTLTPWLKLEVAVAAQIWVLLNFPDTFKCKTEIREDHVFSKYIKWQSALFT